MNLLILIILSLTPYFTATLLFGLPNIHDDLLIHIEKCFYFMLVPMLWQMTLRSAEVFLNARPGKNKPMLLLSSALLIALTVSSLFGLQMVKIRFVAGFFYLILASISVASVSVALHKRGRLYSALAMLSVTELILAHCSFMLLGAGSWQGFLFSCGIILQISAYRLSQLMVGQPYRLFAFAADGKRAMATVPAAITRVYPLTLISGVIITTLMSLIGQLHVIYLALYLILPLVIRLADEYRKNSTKPATIPDFATKNSRILLFVLAMIPALTLLIQR